MVDTLIREAPPATWIAPDGTVRLDRRRPGRQDVDPALIPLLRGQGPAVPDAATDTDGTAVRAGRLMDRDELSPAIGILLGTTLGLAGWGCLAYALI